jgi:hypothetical protein
LNKAWERLIERHDMLRAVILPGEINKSLRQRLHTGLKTADLRWKNQPEIKEHLQNVRENVS